MSDQHTIFEELCMMAAARQLSPFDRRRLDEHLATCDACSNFYQDMMTLAGAVATLEPASVPVPVAASGRVGKSLEIVTPVHHAARVGRVGGWRREWWVVAAASVACFACGIEAARLLSGGIEKTSVAAVAAPMPRVMVQDAPTQVTPSVVPVVTAKKGDEDSKAVTARLQADYETARAELASLREQDQQSVRASEALQADLLRLRQENATQQTALTQIQMQLDQARSNHAQDTKLIALRDDQLRQLTANVVASSSEASEDRKLNEASRLMGQRNLHVVDVYDNSTTGQRSPTFGRVFYSEGGSMLFVAFDLPGHGDGDKTVYHAWGQTEGSSKKPLQLGTFTKDEGTSQRWMMRVSDAGLLKQVDAVFITADHGNNVHAPNGLPLLYAYLRQVPNHP